MSTQQTTNPVADAIDATVRQIKGLKLDETVFNYASPTSTETNAEKVLTEHLRELLAIQAKLVMPFAEASVTDAYGESTMPRIAEALREIDHIRKEVRGVRSLSCLHNYVANPSINRIEGDALAAALDTIEIRAAAVSRLFP